MGKTEENSIEATNPYGRVTYLLAHLPCVAIVKQLLTESREEEKMQQNSVKWWFLEPGKIGESQNGVGRRRRTGTWERKSGKVWHDLDPTNCGYFICQKFDIQYSPEGFSWYEVETLSLEWNWVGFRKLLGENDCTHPAFNLSQATIIWNHVQKIRKSKNPWLCSWQAMGTSTVHVLRVHYDEALRHFGR